MAGVEGAAGVVGVVIESAHPPLVHTPPGQTLTHAPQFSASLERSDTDAVAVGLGQHAGQIGGALQTPALADLIGGAGVAARAAVVRHRWRG